jgi:hypothetical protein
LHAAALLDQFRHQAGPALVAGAQAASVLSMEILIEKQTILPQGIVLKLSAGSMGRPPALFIAEKKAR